MTYQQIVGNIVMTIVAACFCGFLVTCTIGFIIWMFKGDKYKWIK